MLSSLVFANQNSPQTHFLAPAAHRPPFSPPPPYTSLLLPFTFARHRNERHVTATPLIPTTYKCPLSQLLSLHILTNARGVYAESAVSFLKNYLNLAFISVVTNKLAAALLPEVEKGNEVEQDHTEGDEAREDAEPGEHERALVLAGRRRGDSKHEVESPEYFCEKLDHGAPAEMRSDGGSSVRHRSDFFFDFRDIDHDDGIPRTAIEEAAVGALAEAFLAADAQNRVNLDAPKRWTVFVRHPKHAVLDGAVFHAGRRSRAPGAAFGDDSEFFRFLLAGGGDSLGAGFKLLLVGHHSRGFDDFLLRGHGRIIPLFSVFWNACSTRIPRRCRPLFEPVPVPDGAFARKIRHLEILRQFQRIRRARIFAQPAEHAPRSVIGKKGENLAPRRVVPLPAHHNQVLRARQRAQIAPDAQCLAGLRIVVQPRRAPVPLRHHRPLQRVLLCHNVLGILRPKGDCQALQEINLKQPLQEFPHTRSFFRHYVFVKQLLYWLNRQLDTWPRQIFLVNADAGFDRCS